jgi:hypothetical protein
MQFSCKEESATTDSYDKTHPVAKSPAMMADNIVSEVESNSDANIAPQIIKTGRLRFPTSDLNESYTNIISSLKKYKGAVENDTSGKEYEGSFYRNLTIRIPNKNFDAFINDISKGVSYFETKQIQSSDVTEQFIDLTARLKAKKTLEARYLQILNKATKVSEILEIEKQLSSIREEIEAKQAQLNYLEHQVSMSTVSIEMYTETASGNSTTVSYGSKIWNAIVSGFNGISSFFIGILHIWPFILILAVVYFFVKRRIKKNKKA